MGAVRMRRRKEEDSTGSAADCSVAKGTGAIVSRSTADLTKACVCVCVSKALQPSPCTLSSPTQAALPDWAFANGLLKAQVFALLLQCYANFERECVVHW